MSYRDRADHAWLCVAVLFLIGALVNATGIGKITVVILFVYAMGQILYHIYQMLNEGPQGHDGQ